MGDAGTVTFGIPLIARWVAEDWSRVVHQLNATIGSIYAQTDPNFRIILARTDCPELSVPVDTRFEFIHCEQLNPMSRNARMMDGVRKRARAAQRLRELGGGYLMLTDADDLVSNRLVAFVRRDRHPNGYLVRDGYMADAGRGLIAPFPFPDGPAETRFDQECGTSAMPYFAAGDLPEGSDDDACWYGRLMARGHPMVGQRSAAEGRPLQDFPERFVCYVRNTGENLSTASAHTGELHRIPFQASLDDQMVAHRVDRTAQLDSEFNLKAAEQAAHAAPPERRYQPQLGLSVLVSTYRRPAGLRRLLAALRPQVERHRTREIVVVNDGSHDADYAAVASDFADIIRYIALDRNLGIAVARNESIRRAYGVYGVFTDDDCEPPPWWLDWLTARLQLHPEIDVVAGTTRPRHLRNDFREQVLAAWFIPRPWQIGRRDIFVTANAAIRLDMLRDIGGFGFGAVADGRFSEFAGEDTEASLRLHRAGARFAVDPAWWVRHDVDQTLRSTAIRYRRYGASNAAVARLARVDIPLPGAIAVTASRMRAIAALLPVQRTFAASLSGSSVRRFAAAATAAWVYSAYVAGFAAAARSAAWVSNART